LAAVFLFGAARNAIKDRRIAAVAVFPAVLLQYRLDHVGAAALERASALGAGGGTLASLDPYTAGNLRPYPPLARILMPGFGEPRPVDLAPEGFAIRETKVGDPPEPLDEALQKAGYASVNLAGSTRRRPSAASALLRAIWADFAFGADRRLLYEKPWNHIAKKKPWPRRSSPILT
jgi:hypothetical protein